MGDLNMTEAQYAEFLKSPEVWRVFFPPGFVTPGELDPNYVPADYSTLMMGITILNIVISVFVVFPRLFSRLFVVRNFKIDDWLIIPAFLAHMASITVIIWAIKAAGLGKHMYDCTPTEIANWYRVQYALNITMLTGLFLTRMSILFFLRSLAGNAEVKSRFVITAMQVINFLHWVGFMNPTIFMCVPEFRNWSILYLVSSGCMAESYKVVAIQKAGVALGVVGAVVDIAILAIPIRLVWQLHLPVKQRIIVSGLFGVGSLACIAAVCKAAYTFRQLEQNANRFDMTWSFVPILSSALFEETLALVTACGPGLKPLFSRALPLLSTLRGGSRSKLMDNESAATGYSEAKVPRGTIGSAGKKAKQQGQYGMESIGLSTVDSGDSILARSVEADSVEEGWRGTDAGGDWRAGMANGSEWRGVTPSQGDWRGGTAV